MRLGRLLLGSAILLITTLPSIALTHARRGPTSPKMFNKRSKSVKVGAKHASQMSIGSDRATEIQEALIRAGYLSGEPSGTWDSPTQSAMQKLQSENGWQTKLVPDSRAIIKLGLGPVRESASINNPTEQETRSSSASTY